jgi:hypothetical protein
MHRSGSIRHEAKCRGSALDVGLWFGILVKVAEELVSVYLRGGGQECRPAQLASNPYGTFTVTVAMLRPYWFVA